MKFSVERKFFLFLCVIFLSLAVVRFSGFRTLSDRAQIDRQFVQSQSLLTTLSTTLMMIQSSESGQRGYLITGDKAYLELYHRNSAMIDAQVRALRDLISDNPAHQDQMNELEPLIKAKFAEMQDTIDLRNSQGFDAAAKLVLSHLGKSKMDAIIKVVSLMETTESARWADYSSSLEATRNSQILRFWIINGLELLALSLGYLLISRYMSRQREAEAMVRDLNQTLSRSVAELKTIFDLAPIGIAVAEDAKCQSIRPNRDFAQMLRIARDPDSSRIPSTEQRFTVTRNGTPIGVGEMPLQYAAATGIAVKQAELEIRFPDGQTLNLLCSAEPLFDQTATPRGAIAAYLDIAQIKKAEVEIRQSRELFRNAFEESGIGMALVSLKGKFLKVNQTLCQIVGYPAEELLLRDFQSITYPPDLGPDLDFVRRMVAGEVRSFQLKKRYFRRDGSVVWVMLTSSLVREPDGTPLYFVSQIQDIDEATKTQEERDRVFELSQDMICVAGTDGYFKRVNPAATSILGYSARELTSRPFLEFIAPNDRERTRNEVINLGAGAQTIDFENRFVCSDGTIKWLSWHATPVANEGLIYAVGRDVTQQHLAVDALSEAKQAAEAANLAKSAFLANMSHEIRTPLTAIFGFADMLMSPTLSLADRLAHVQTIRRNGEHLLSVINDVLDVSKIEAGKMQVEIMPASLPTILADIASLMRQRATSKGLDFQIIGNGPLPQTIQTDPTRLRQILFNLIGNAIKFTHKGLVVVVVMLIDGENGASLSISVSDSGIGMSLQQQELIFAPFTQTDPSHARKFGGTGLGLNISKRLAQMLGGDIGVTSEPGIGSTFTVMINVGNLAGVRMIDDLNKAMASCTYDDGAQPMILATGRVLLAEDSYDNQRLIAYHLESMGVEVELAVDGRMAVDKAMDAIAEGRPFGLILMDMQMPEVDGYAATHELRSRGYKGPIVALTANAMEQDRQRCAEVGCDQFLSKPIQLDAFRKTVAYFLKPDRSPGA